MAFNNSPELQIMQLYSLCILCKVVFFYPIIILALRHEKAAGAECAQPL